MEKQKIIGNISKTVVFLIVLIGAFTMVFPYLWMLGTSFKTPQESFSLIPTFIPQEWQSGTYKEIWGIIPLLKAVKNTLVIEVSVIVTGTLVSSLAAFSFAKLRLPHKNTLLLILMSSMMIPYAALLLPQYRAYESFNLTNTLWPLILPGFFGNVSMMFFLIQFMKGIPSVLFESAVIDGASYFRQYRSIMLPLIKPAIAAQVIFWFVGIWNDYFAPSIYLTDPKVQTLQPLLASLNSTYASGTNYPIVMTGAVLSSIPMLVIFILFQKYFVQSLALTGVKG